MNTTFLIPFLATVLSMAWLNGTKATCERKDDYVHFFNTIQFNGLFSILFLCVVAGLIIAWVNAGFIVFLEYLGCAIGTIIVGSMIPIPILIKIFGYQGFGIILPIISAIGCAIWMFIQSGTF